MQTVRFGIHGLGVERKGGDVTEGRGTREYVRSMFEGARANGQPDPIPTNKQSAAFAPAVGVHGGRKYRKLNAGL